jgi:hypothetical protein
MAFGFYHACEPLFDRRRFLKLALAAGIAPALIADPHEGRSPEDGVQRFIEQHAITPYDPWAVVHGIRALGSGCRLGGETAAAYVLRTCVREREVNGKGYLYIPANFEVHTNMFLKTFLEAGVPLSEAIPLGGRLFHLADLGDGAKALFRFDPSTFDRNDLAWSLIAFAELRADAWVNAYGEKVQLQQVAAFGLNVLQEATAGIKRYCRASLPLPQKMPIHSFTCGGTHLVYSVLVAARDRFLAAADQEAIREQLQILMYRLQADPDLIDRYYRELSSAPGVDMFRAAAKLKILGHALECLGYAQAHGLLQPNPIERQQIEKAVQEVRSLLSYGLTLDLATIRRRDAQLAQQVVGDTCHAYRCLSLV